MPGSSNQAYIPPSTQTVVDKNQALIDENEQLRQKVAALEADSKFTRELHQTLSSAINVGYWEWDETTDRPCYISRELANIFGLSLEFLYTFKGEQDFFPFIHPDDLEQYIENLGTILNPDFPRGLAHGFDYRIVRPDGDVRYVRELEYGVLKENGQIIRSYGAIQDITDYRESALALKESQQRYRSLIEQLPIGVEEQDYSPIKKAVDKLRAEGVEDLKAYFKSHPEFLFDIVNQSRIVSANSKLLEIQGVDSLDHYFETESDTADWWNDEWAEFHASEIAALASPAKLHYGELTETRADDSEFQMRLISSVVEGDEDTWNRVLTVLEDITERKNYEANLIAAKTMAEKASRAKTEFLSNMSHELRTPLNAILGYSQLFEFDRSLGKKRQSNARAISNAGQHLLNLVNEILDLSLIETGNIELLIEPVSLHSVIADCVGWVSEMAESHGVEIELCSEACSGVMVAADEIRLKQVMLNLLSNAVKYNSDEGKVRIGCAQDRMGSIDIAITDNGPGISPDRLHELFKPFNRLGAEFSAIEGTGIGLAITRQLVDLMRGELVVDSVPGEGSTFTVRLETIRENPVDCEVSIRDNDTAENDPADSNIDAPKILVAEDNQVNRELIEVQLEHLGYKADFVENGVEALKRWQVGNYQLLLTDIRMPQMDGYELIRQIRALGEASESSPIIAATANAMETDVKQCLDTGASDVISKPFGLTELKQIMDKWLPQQVGTVASAAASPSAAEVPTEEAIDLSVLEDLTAVNSDAPQRLLQAYIDSLPDELDNIRQALDSRDYEGLGDYAHKLKSSSASLGAQQMASLCQRLEHACREDRETDIKNLVPRLLQAAKPVEAFVEGFCDKAFGVNTITTWAADNGIDKQVRVLLVDDDHIMHRIIKLILDDLGIHRVQTALSGQQALTMLEQQPGAIDVILCDLNMPEMDGIEFTRHLSQQKYSGSLALLSGEDIRILRTVEKLAIEHELKVLGVIEKPVTLAQMRRLFLNHDQGDGDQTIRPEEAFSPEDLAQAINTGELDTFFQPKIDVKTGQITGVEALARWMHPSRGLVGPHLFIPIAEEHGLISALTREVCRKSLQYAAAWKAGGMELDVAINISIDSLNDLEWPNAVLAQVTDAGLQSSSVTFEITESRLMEHKLVALDILGRLGLKRFNLSIDDFGTGYSSMEQLQRIPFSELKIDRAFVRGASDDASSRAILESTILLAKKLNMNIVAEGVEDEADWDLVAKLGCDQVQGYYIAKPMPADQLGQWLSTQKIKSK